MTQVQPPHDQLREVMASRAGRDVIWHLLGLGQLYHNPYSPDIAGMSYACGQRESAIRLSGWLMTECPDNYILMQQEQLNVSGLFDAGHYVPDDRNGSAALDAARRAAAERRAALIDGDGAGLGAQFPLPGGPEGDHY